MTNIFAFGAAFITADPLLPNSDCFVSCAFFNSFGSTTAFFVVPEKEVVGKFFDRLKTALSGCLTVRFIFIYRRSYSGIRG